MFRKLALGAFLLAISAPRVSRSARPAASRARSRTPRARCCPAPPSRVSGTNIVGAQTAVTNEQGFYRFSNLPPGEYQLTFSPRGLQDRQPRGMRVSVGSTIEENARARGERSSRSRSRWWASRRWSTPPPTRSAPTTTAAGWRTRRCAATASSTWSASAPGSLDGRRREQRPAHHGLRLLLRRELVPGRRRRHHGQLLQRGARRAQHGRDRGGRGPLARRARRVRQPDRRRLQHRDPPGHERVPRRRRTSTASPTA